jgi:hypothetical protein
MDLLQRCMPAKDAVVFGDIYIVDGGYTQKCVELGCGRALLIDTVETPRWVQARLKEPRLDYYKGDFSNPLFMKSFSETFDVGVVFDILLHQAPLLGTVNLMLEKVRRFVCIAQPMLEEQPVPNSLVYLPGLPPSSGLYPLDQQSQEYKLFDPEQVNHTHWLWGMTPSFLKSSLRGEGFEVVHEARLANAIVPNKKWYWWGCIAERRRENPSHWSRLPLTQGITTPSWS